MLKGFDPIIPEKPRLMILGSMPSVTYLDKQEYYGFAHNRFWKILHAVFEMPIDTYAQKKEILFQQHILLWDVIGECEREGSLDSAIRKERVNDIAHLTAVYPTLHRVICNGRKAYELYQKHFPDIALPCSYLPSTSNANRSIREEVLFAQWKQALMEHEGDM